MSRIIWPFCPLIDHIESLEWATDLFSAKSAEQRIALRTAPRRIFHFEHILSDYQLTAARQAVRSAQGADGFLVPDWPQAVDVGAVAPGTPVDFGGDPDYQDFGSKALLWESVDNFEQVAITKDSASYSADTVTGNYTAAKLIPLWNGISLDGLRFQQIGANNNRASIALLATENTDLGNSSYSQYQGHDIMPDCPVVVGGLDGSLTWLLDNFDNTQSNPYPLRSRSLPEYGFAMRWHVFSDADKWTLRQWIYSRRGRQKVFWFSTYSKDLEPAAAISGTTVTVYAPPGYTSLQSTFDIEVKSTTANYRRVTSHAAGTPIGGRATIDLTIDSSLTAALGDIQRISFLRCARFDADRLEFLHGAKGGMEARMPCLEVTEP